MRFALQTACVFLVGLALLGSAGVLAQSALNTADQPALWQQPPAEDAAAPDVYLLPDASGKLRQVLGFHYEDFLRAWNSRDAGASGPPRYSIEAANSVGTIGESRVQLRIEIKIASHKDGWIDVPLKLPDLIVERIDLGQQAKGECVVYDAAKGGHVAWLQGQAGEDRTITIVGSAKISANGGGSALDIALPQTMISQLKLTAPAADLQFAASAGVELTTTAAEMQTEAVLRGNANPLHIEWHPRQAPAQAIALESKGEMTVNLERNRASYSARLALDSFGNLLEQVRIRLPQGASMGQVRCPPELEATIAQAEDEIGGIVEVRCARPTGKPWVIEIAAEQTLSEGGGETICPIGGFEVLGAVRQSGKIVLEVDEDLQVYFDLSEGLEQAPLDEASPTGTPNTALAAFNYTRIPWTLSVHALRKERRVNIEPQYHLQLGPEEARLEAQFDYQFTGAKTFSVRVDLRGWHLAEESLETGGAVEAGRIVETEGGLLVLPLVNPDAQRARISLKFHKPLALGEQRFELPEPLGGFVLPGQLSLEADPALQVSTDVARLEGLGEVPTEQESAGDQSLQEFRTFLPRASLGATLSRRPREVQVGAHTHVDVGDAQLAVRQQFDYLVKYRPVEELQLLAPETLPEQTSCKVLVEGKELPATTATTEPPQGEATERKLLISLPRAVQGSVRVELSYEFPYSGAVPGSPVELALPLANPAEPMTVHEVSVEARQPRRVVLGQKAGAEVWTVLPVETSAGAATTTWHFQSAAAQSTVPLTVQVDSEADLENAILERTWLQSWVAGSVQQDRAIFQFRTPHAAVHVALPEKLAQEPMEVMLDGEAVDFDPPRDGRISVALAHASPRVAHVLELRYQRPVSLLSGVPLRTELPRLVCRPMSAPVYWQLVLPHGWHVVQSPTGMTSESWLGWKSYRWGRQPTRSQGELEQWTGASPAPAPPETTNQYLYSSFQIPEAAAVVVTRQIWLVLATALSAFGLAMLCVYTPMARRFAFWSVLTLILLGLVFMYPEITLLAGQSILWGGLIGVAAWALRRSFAAQSAGDVSRTGASSLVGTTSATQSWAQKQRVAADGDDSPTIAARLEGSQL